MSHSGGFDSDRQRRWWFATHGGDAQIPAFHGSSSKFDRFDLSKSGTATDDGDLGRGLYFSTDSKGLKRDKFRYEVSLSIRTPLRMSMTSWGGNKKAMVREALGLPLTATAEEVRLEAMKQGYDSIVLDYSPLGYHHKEIAVFDEKAVFVRNRVEL